MLPDYTLTIRRPCEGGKMKKSLIWMSILFISCAHSKLDIEHIQDKILSVINRQQQAWNNRDIEGFMSDYWKSEKMTFQSGNTRLEGWDMLLNRYKKNYAGEKMGKLVFSDIVIKVLTHDYAYVLGRWKVEHEDSVKEGLYTIILKRFPGGWKIIHDQS
jgi:beta-aspartyl-peptidase (threonine type)